MCMGKRLSKVFQKAKDNPIPFDDSSKLAFFSDCHRGDGSWADDFARNENLLCHALDHYYEEGFTYFEIGDGDELWENRHFRDVEFAHRDVFKRMRRLHVKGRLYLIWGNHDGERRSSRNVRQNLYKYYDERTGKDQALFDGIDVHEGLVLKHSDTGKTIFLVHGHQGDLMSDYLWPLGRYFVRHVWRHWQVLGVRDPTSPASNTSKAGKVEIHLEEWAEDKHQMLIAGHTHLPRFPQGGNPPYFNCGCCVYPHSITGIEIQNGDITLVRWLLRAKENDGVLYVHRDVRDGPERLRAFL